MCTTVKKNIWVHKTTSLTWAIDNGPVMFVALCSILCLGAVDSTTGIKKHGESTIVHITAKTGPHYGSENQDQLSVCQQALLVNCGTRTCNKTYQYCLDNECFLCDDECSVSRIEHDLIDYEHCYDVCPVYMERVVCSGGSNTKIPASPVIPGSEPCHVEYLWLVIVLGVALVSVLGVCIVQTRRVACLERDLKKGQNVHEVVQCQATEDLSQPCNDSRHILHSHCSPTESRTGPICGDQSRNISPESGWRLLATGGFYSGTADQTQPKQHNNVLLGALQSSVTSEMTQITHELNLRSTDGEDCYIGDDSDQSDLTPDLSPSSGNIVHVANPESANFSTVRRANRNHDDALVRL